MAQTYADAGVDLASYDNALARLKGLVESTRTREVAEGFGAFAGLYELPGIGHLAASADGVGTKVKVAIATGQHVGIGHDLVNHCLNDIAVMGARPLFMLDYFASGRLDEHVLLDVVRGVTEACSEAGCALLGGETAEMPGVYAPGDYDLAGFAVGLVEPGWLPRVDSVRPGDLLVGLPSNGLHTNGYSLARRVLDGIGLDAQPAPLDAPLGQALLKPHRMYAKTLHSLWPRWKVAAHITGGGLPGNLPRVLPQGAAAHIRVGSWSVPPVFQLIQARGGIDDAEMRNTFNLGIGMVLAVAPESARDVTADGATVIGEVVPSSGSPRVIFE